MSTLPDTFSYTISINKICVYRNMTFINTQYFQKKTQICVIIITCGFQHFSTNFLYTYRKIIYLCKYF